MHTNIKLHCEDETLVDYASSSYEDNLLKLKFSCGLHHD